MIMPFTGRQKKRTPYQGTSLGASEGHARVHARRRGDGGREAALLPEEMTGQPARGHDPCSAPVLLAAVPGDVGLARGLIAMNGKVVSAALAEVYCAMALGLGHALLARTRGLADVDDHLVLLEEG